MNMFFATLTRQNSESARSEKAKPTNSVDIHIRQARLIIRADPPGMRPSGHEPIGRGGKVNRALVGISVTPFGDAVHESSR
jgi:hypothetical protein